MRKTLLAWLMGLCLPCCFAQPGYIHGNGDPRNSTPTPNCAASRFYVDDSNQALYMAASGSPCTWTPAGAAGSFDGGTVTNPIVLPADPTLALQATTKQYVDNQGGSKIPATVLITVAASNSVNRSRAQYVATGTNDQTTINAAINACPATLAASAGPAQCTVVLQPGVYNVSDSVVIDADDVTLTGEGHCMWGGWNNVWVGTGSPNGAIGTGCSQLKASTTGFPIVAIKHVNVPAGTGANANNTHRGISIKQLYIVGNSYLNQGIVTVGNGGTCNTSYTYDGTTITGCTDDNVEIADNVIQRTNLGIGVSLDTPHIHGNSVQDNNGPGEMICGWFARVHDELVFDNQGPLIIACSVGGKYVNNTLGDSSLDGIDFEVNSSSASNNSFLGIVGSAMHIKSVSGTVLNGNTVDYATPIDFNVDGQLPTSADAILEDSGASNNTITNNNLQSAVNQTGYAINAQGTQGTVTGNWTSGTWRFGNVGPAVSINLSHTTHTDSGAGNSLTWATGNQTGFRSFIWDTFASNLPSYSIAGGSTGGNTGIIFQTKNPTYGIPTIQLGTTTTGGAVDLYSYRSWQATNTYDQFFASANAAASAALHRVYITGHATTGLVQVENATLTVGGTEGTAGPFSADTSGNTIVNNLTVNGSCAGCGSASLPAYIRPSTAVPTVASLTAVNQSTGTAVDSASGIFMHHPVGATDFLFALTQNVPGATPYTFTVAVQPQMFSQNYMSLGICVSDGTQFITMGPTFNTAFIWGETKWTSATAFSADYTGLAAFPTYFPMATMWLRLNDNGTNRIWSYSYDGTNFITIHTETRTDFLTATKLGIFLKVGNATSDAYATFSSWKVN